VSEVDLNEPPAVGGYSVTLPTFEGPLDLLLHLCQKHELDILDIPIAFVTEKYLEYLAVMQLINLDVASEYLVMAATLAHIKSKMLLPAPPPGQEDELSVEEADPREALIRRLLEYQKYKLAGDELATRGVAQQNVFTRGMPIEEAAHTGLPPLAQVPLFSLVEAFQSVLSKSKIKLSHDIVHERVTLADRINELVDILRVKRRVTFEELFEGLETRFDLVITFLALLEMTRLRMTRLFQADFDSHIYIEFTAQATTDENGEPGPTAAFLGEDGQVRFDGEASTVFDTEGPPASSPSDDEAALDEASGPFDTEAPPPDGFDDPDSIAMDLHIVPNADDEARAPSTWTIPSPPFEQSTGAPGDDAPAELAADPAALDDDAPADQLASSDDAPADQLASSDDAPADQLASSDAPADQLASSDAPADQLASSDEAHADQLASSDDAPADQLAANDDVHAEGSTANTVDGELESDARDDDAEDENT